MVGIGGWWLASIDAPAWTLFALVGAAMIVFGLTTAASIRLTRVGQMIRASGLFSGMQPSGPNKWSGQIYNADDDNSYASNISVSDPHTLKVEGCVGALCGGENWTRSAR